MNALWEICKSEPWVAFWIVVVLAWAVTRPFRYAFIAYNRALRARNIAAHGWPKAPIDADGDVVYPEKK